MRDYRIKHVPSVGYFAQVKNSYFKGWRTLGKNCGGSVGEYGEDHLAYPLSREEAINLARTHNGDIIRSLKKNISYEPYTFEEEC